MKQFSLTDNIVYWVMGFVLLTKLLYVTVKDELVLLVKNRP